jgi:DNA-binding NarL/FixJ family response regulator
MADRQLRPIERTVRRLRQDGLSNSEVAWRLRRSPGYVRRVDTLSRMERPTQPVASEDVDGGEVLRPIERCVLKSLQAGAGYAEIAARLRRSPTYVSRVEQFANLRMELDVA